MRNQRYDVIIIGTGAGGGTMAHALSDSGARILVLERGDFVPREEENWSPEAVWKHLRYRVRERWIDRSGQEFQPYTHYCVGGNTKFWGSVLYRLRREDFQAMEHLDGLSPEWPIDYDTLEPYYDRAERLYHVRGQHGVDPSEAPRRPFPYEAVPHARIMSEIVEQLRQQGLNPSSLPLGLLRLGQEGGCVLCSTCNSFPCKIHAKSDAEACCIHEAVRRPTVTLWTNALARRLVADSCGRKIEAVDVERNGKMVRVEAPLVIVSCGAVNSAALLLRSASDRHPRGLANGSDTVGRHYMGHVNSVLMAVSKCPNPTVFQKTLALNDFYFGSEDWDHPMGHISFVGKLDGETLKAGAPAIAPGFTLDLMAKHSLDFWLTSEDLPDPDNRVTLDREGNIVLAYKPNNEEGHRRLIAKLKSLMSQQTKCRVHGHECHEGLFARNLYLGQRIPLAGVAHQNGTIRFGRDPKTSALDANCKAHELDNLYVVDASCFPSSAAVNPALTIMANALRVGEHLKERLA